MRKNIFIGDRLNRRIEDFDGELNVSEICQAAILEAIVLAEIRRKREGDLDLEAMLEARAKHGAAIREAGHQVGRSIAASGFFEWVQLKRLASRESEGNLPEIFESATDPGDTLRAITAVADDVAKVPSETAVAFEAAVLEADERLGLGTAISDVYTLPWGVEFVRGAASAYREAEAAGRQQDAEAAV